MSDKIRALRILEYIGPKDRVQGALDNSLKGVNHFSDLTIVVRDVLEPHRVEQPAPKIDPELEGSIDKWDGIILRQGADHGTYNCPLCKKYKQRGLGCEGCIIREVTDGRGCSGTPYVEWAQHMQRKHPGLVKRIYCKECERLAVNMRNSLVDLRKEVK